MGGCCGSGKPSKALLYIGGGLLIIVLYYLLNGSI
jgi:hypothetical protein